MSRVSVKRTRVSVKRDRGEWLVRIDAVQICDLGPSEVASWRALQSSNPSLASPYFTPEYAQLIGHVRRDSRVAMIEDGGRVQGFLAVQRPAGSAAMPLGAPISDYQGFVAQPDLDVRLPDVCRALDIGRLDFSHVPAEQAPFAAHANGVDATWIAEVSVGADEYFAGARSRRPQFLYQLGRTRRKLVRERGDVAFTAGSSDHAHLNTLLAWKDRQLERTRQPPVWRARWVREALLGSVARASANFAGMLFTLTRDDQLIAANFCLRSTAVLHGLIMAHDSEFDAYSPGLQLVRHVLEWAGSNGFREVDFGMGEQLYKRQFGTYRRAVVSGWAGTRSLASFSRTAQYALRRQIERVPNRWIASLPGRAMRRLDVYRGLSAPNALARGSR